MTGYNPGTFCCVDLATVDAAGAKQFYQTLFGWEAVDIPIGEDREFNQSTQHLH